MQEVYKLLRHDDSRYESVNAAIDKWMIHFAANCTTDSHNAFQWSGNPKIVYIGTARDHGPHQLA